MSFNRVLVDQPEPAIAGSAVVIGEVHVGAGAILAQGLVVRAHGGAVSRHLAGDVRLPWRDRARPGLHSRARLGG